MKYVKTFLSVLFIVLLLSGCSFRISSSIDDLISPLSPFGDNANIKNALDTFAQNGYSLKAPNSGDYITSYNFYDIDGDGTDEAVAFYEPSDNLGTIDMAIIKKSGDKWSVVENIQGEGKEVHSLDFSDINGDGMSELILNWDVITNSTNHELSVYRVDFDEAENKIIKIGDSVTVNNYIVVDMFNDGSNELLMFELNSGTSTTAKAELYTYEDNQQILLGETKLDAHINSYEYLQIEDNDGKISVYADALGSDGASMLTEIIYWSSSYKTIVSPFYSYSTGLTADTLRSSTVKSLDVNDDGLFEIPLDYETSFENDQVDILDWNVYKHTILMHSAYSIYSEADDYTILISDDIVDQIDVTYNEENHEMIVLNAASGEEIFSVKAVLKATYSEEKYSGYTNILDDSGYCYLARQGTDTEITVTVDELKNSIKSLR